MIKAIKLIDYFFKFERASYRSSGGRGVDRLHVIGRRDALVTERFCYREFRYRKSRVYYWQNSMWTSSKNGLFTWCAKARFRSRCTIYYFLYCIKRFLRVLRMMLDRLYVGVGHSKSEVYQNYSTFLPY